MRQEPTSRGDRKGTGGGNDSGGVLTGFVQFLRSGIDRFGDHRVVVRVADGDGDDTAAQARPARGAARMVVRLDLPVTSVECDHDLEMVCLMTPGLLPPKGAGKRRPATGEEDDEAGEKGLLMRDLLNQLSTAVAQGPEYALALCDVQDPPGGDGAKKPKQRQLIVEGLQVKPRPGRNTLRFVVTVAG